MTTDTQNISGRLQNKQIVRQLRWLSNYIVLYGAL